MRGDGRSFRNVNWWRAAMCGRRMPPGWPRSLASHASTRTIGKPTLLRSGPEGGLLNNGTHAIDLARFLLGDPAALWVIGQVERRTDRYERGHPIEDRCAGLIGFEGGARLVIESDMPQDWPG